MDLVSAYLPLVLVMLLTGVIGGLLADPTGCGRWHL